MTEKDYPVALYPQELAKLIVARANTGDVEGMIALYEPGATLAIGNGRVVKGQEAIRTFYAEMLTTRKTFDLGRQRPAIVSGKFALTSTRLPNGTVTAEVAHQQPDSSWRWVIDQPAIFQTET